MRIREARSGVSAPVFAGVRGPVRLAELLGAAMCRPLSFFAKFSALWLPDARCSASCLLPWRGELRFDLTRGIWKFLRLGLETILGLIMRCALSVSLDLKAASLEPAADSPRGVVKLGRSSERKCTKSLWDALPRVELAWLDDTGGVGSAAQPYLYRALGASQNTRSFEDPPDGLTRWKSPESSSSCPIRTASLRIFACPACLSSQVVASKPVNASRIVEVPTEAMTSREARADVLGRTALSNATLSASSSCFVMFAATSRSSSAKRSGIGRSLNSELKICSSSMAYRCPNSRSAVPTASASILLSAMRCSSNHETTSDISTVLGSFLIATILLLTGSEARICGTS
mmetsp:Transcript_15512/g.41691  ORF Transcript_15512/g.41691 Transcript_15512/m.41691 type:complete len:346 (+) Transcript_15512:460-1497(+)